MPFLLLCWNKRSAQVDIFITLFAELLIRIWLRSRGQGPCSIKRNWVGRVENSELYFLLKSVADLRSLISCVETCRLLISWRDFCKAMLVYIFTSHPKAYKDEQRSLECSEARAVRLIWGLNHMTLRSRANRHTRNNRRRKDVINVKKKI